jgi:hypothetical protein
MLVAGPVIAPQGWSRYQGVGGSNHDRSTPSERAPGLSLLKLKSGRRGAAR